MIEYFGKKWTEEITPEWAIRKGRYETKWNQEVDNIVLMYDKSPVQGKYLIMNVGEVTWKRDDLMWSYTVGYKLPMEAMTLKEYDSQRWVLSKCIVRRLALLMSKEEQEEFLAVDDGDNNKESKVWGMVKQYMIEDHDANEEWDLARKWKTKIQKKWILEY